LDRPLVVLYVPPGELTPQLESYARGIIHPKDRRRFGKWTERKIAYFAGRAALRAGLEKLKVTGKVLPNPEFGYLTLETSVPLYGNISHTHGLVAAVIGKHPIGVDVEKGARDASRVMKRVATEKERSEWEVPIELWSAKEAFSKAFGLGMRFGLQAFEVHWAVKGPWRGIARVEGPLKVASPAILQEKFDTYLVSLATESSDLGSGFEVMKWSGP